MARVPVGAYVPGDSFFHRAHPFVKFYWVFSFVIFCFSIRIHILIMH